MSDLIPFIVVGVSTGAIYGLAGTGLVLTYRTSGILNFAHGAFATLAAYALYDLYVERDMPVGPALVIAVVGVGTVIGLLAELAARRLAGRSFAMQVTATVGALIAVQAALVLHYGAQPRRYPRYLPDNLVRIGGTNVRVEQIVVVVVSVVLAFGLFWFLAASRLGRSMRGIVENPELLSLGGTNPVRVRRWAWVIGSVFATISGVLIAPNLQLDATILTLLIVQAFGAAAIGGFTSLPLTWFGGIALGVLAAVATKYTGTVESLRGLSASLPFFALIVVLLVRRPPSPIAARPNERPPAMEPVSSLKTVLLPAAVVLPVLGVVPFVVGYRLDAWTSGLVSFIILMSLGFLVRTSGQISLCHVTFAAIGATTFSRLATDANLPWIVALLGAGLIAAPIGALVAIPAVRLSGMYLALVTLGFGIVVQQMFYSSGLMFGRQGLGVSMPRPEIFGIDLTSSTRFYFVVLAIAILVAAALTTLTMTRLGRLLRALNDSPLGLATAGTSLVALRVVVFCVSASAAAIGGALSGMVVTRASATSFMPFESLVLLVLVVISIGRAPWYALAPAVLLELVPTYLSGSSAEWLRILFGVAAIAVGIGLIGPRHRGGADRLDERSEGSVPAKSVKRVVELPEPAGLEVVNVSVRFGSVCAVDQLSLSASAGMITGLIGPNGAGKSTTFNVCSGLVQQASGAVLLGGDDISALPPGERARRGLGRTFQHMELYDSLTVLENVALGSEAGIAGRNPLRHLRSKTRESAQIQQASMEAIELCGLEVHTGSVVGQLSTGTRRLVELARCLAGSYRFMLLDEPSSGLDTGETAAFGDLLVRVVQERGCGILLVEHDMALVTSVCDYIYVLEFGQLIYSGTSQEVLSSDLVRKAYLGTLSDLETSDLEPSELVPETLGGPVS